MYGREFYLDLDEDGPAPTDLKEFHQQIQDCQKCRLAEHRTHFVFGVGPPTAKVMCIGEGPGYEEDQQGEPFVGPAGQMLNRILAAIGFEREEVYIANIVKCRPPANRNPEAEEIAACLPYLEKQIDLVRPKLILALGKVAAQSLLQTNAPIGALRGRVYRYRQAELIVTYHPAALLRDHKWKPAAWEDAQKLRRLYDERVGDKPPLTVPKRRKG